jgi:hypothetical protein
MDRFGRGGSGDSSDYDVQREAEDVAAVVEAISGWSVLPYRSLILRPLL